MSGKEKNISCPLCRLARGLDRKTRVYYEDSMCVVVDCQTCGVPMLVFKFHREWSRSELDYCLDVAHILFGWSRFNVRFQRRKIPDHPHFHILREKSR